MRKPSPATIVALAALFIALGGVGVAATGGNFILGHSNSAANTSALAATVAGGKALEVSNTNTTSGSAALGLNVAPGHAPFTVNTGAKVANLNADLLDSHDSGFFLPKTGKATDSDMLDGLDSSAFTRGGGQLYSGHVERVQVGGEGALLTIPGVMTLKYVCVNPEPEIIVTPSNLDMVFWRDSGMAGFIPRSSQAKAFFAVDKIFVHMLASRPMSKNGDLPVVVDLQTAGGWDPALSECTFQAVAESFA
jgi:hypothetical protein